MSSLYLATILLAAPPATQEAHRPLMAPIPLFLPAESPPAGELRKAYEKAIRSSYQANVTTGVPELVAVFRQLERDQSLPAPERAQLRHKARVRLLSLGDKIVGDARHARYQEKQREALARFTPHRPLEAPSVEASGSGRPSDYVTPRATSAASGAAGGLGEDEGEALVELIRNVIAPDSWDTAGGPGSIVYYRQWQALVVRQTQENHWLIGGMRDALEKAR